MTSWCSRKQKSVALSSAKAEYMAASIASCEAIWLRKFRLNLLKEKMEVTIILSDNHSCIKLFENPMFHDQSKHIDIRCHFIKDCPMGNCTIAVHSYRRTSGEYPHESSREDYVYLFQRKDGDDQESISVVGMDRLKIQRELQ